MIKTTPAKGVPLPWQESKNTGLADLKSISVHSDPLPTKRQITTSKYASHFAKMDLGQNIRCKPTDVNKVSQAMRKYIRENKLQAEVVSRIKCEDGIGRVWMVEPGTKKKQKF